MVWFISVHVEWVSCWFRTWLKFFSAKVPRYPKEVNIFFYWLPWRFSSCFWRIFCILISSLSLFFGSLFENYQSVVTAKADVDVRYLFKLRKEVAPNQFGFFCSVVSSYSDIEECAGISLLPWISVAKNEWLFGMYDCLAVISWDGHVIWRWVKGNSLSTVSVMERGRTPLHQSI